MKINLTDRINNLSPSPTLQIASKAAQMRANGIDVISFSIGEPDFDTPAYVRESAKEAIDNGFTKYTPSAGIKELRKAVSEKFEEDNNLQYNPDGEIMVSSGAKEIIYLALQALCNSGDEVIIPSPYWVSYPEQVKLAGARPVVVPADEKGGFKIDSNALSQAITPRTKLLILNSPNNPTGAVYKKAELEQLCSVIISKNIFVISDEVYEKIIYNGHHFSICCLSKEMKRRTLLVNALSKTYAMTGWRLGYCAGDSRIISAMTKLQSQINSHPSSITQKAGVTALEGPQGEVKVMVAEFKNRRDYVLERLKPIKALSCDVPDGAFYVFPRISSVFGKELAGRKIANSVDFAAVLLEQARVAVVPGKAFGSDEHIRLSYAASPENIKEGMNRIEGLLK